MRIRRSVLGVGLAAATAIGLSGIAAAQSPETHLMTVRLPGGGVAEIHYSGPVAPRVDIDDAPAMMLPSLFAADAPFVEFDRIAAAMDREADRMFREAAAIAADPARLTPAATATLPAGSQEYTYVSTLTGNGVCSRSVTITAQGNGAPPRVVTHASGNCGAAGADIHQVPTQLPAAPAPSNGPHMIMTKATAPHPNPARLQEASLR
ncbi:MAG TPA: hypothetical protein VG651_13290 [Stellaceae bacterium]|nr:hypothetical protein [Stellaceae bacterium]